MIPMSIIRRRTESFMEKTGSEIETAATLIGEDLVENARAVDNFFSSANSKFNCTDPDHIRLLAKMDIVNDLITDLAHKV